jgi:hypothetical protein
VISFHLSFVSLQATLAAQLAMQLALASLGDSLIGARTAFPLVRPHGRIAKTQSDLSFVS